jgi:hypothetical protein
VAGRRNPESRKELEEKELENKRARGEKELEETKKEMIILLSPLYNPTHLQARLEAREMERAVPHRASESHVSTPLLMLGTLTG